MKQTSLFGFAFQSEGEVLLARHDSGFVHTRCGNIVAVYTHYGTASFVHVEHEGFSLGLALIEYCVEDMNDKLHCGEVVVVYYHLVATRFAQVDIGAIAY